MKILLLNYEYPPIGGGAGNQTKLLAEEFVKTGHQVRIITSHFKGLPYYEKNHNLEIIRVPVFRRFKERSHFLQMFLYLKVGFIPFFLTCWKWKPDIILSFFLLPTSFLPFFQKVFFKIPYVISLRGADVPSFIPGEVKIYKFLKPLARIIGNNSQKMIAVSRDLAELAGSDFPKYKNKILYINNGIRISKTEKIKSKKTKLLFVGRLTKQKNLSFVIKALTEIKEDFEFRIIGDGPLKSELIKLTKVKNLTDKVKFLGWKEKNEVFQEMLKASFLILFSEIEGLSNAGLEAYAHGLPIIASNQPGIRDFVIDGETGFLINKNDEEKLQQTIIKLIKSDYSHFSQNCKNFVRKNYNIEQSAEKYLKLFKEILRKNDE